MKDGKVAVVRVVRCGNRGRLAIGNTFVSPRIVEAASYCGSLNAAFAPILARERENERKRIIEALQEKAKEAKPFGDIAVVGFEAAIVVVRALASSAEQTEKGKT